MVNVETIHGKIKKKRKRVINGLLLFACKPEQNQKSCEHNFLY